MPLIDGSTQLLAAEPELLFRQDSVYTDIAGRFMRCHGAKYLRKALKSPLSTVLQRVKAGDEFAGSARKSGLR